MGAAGYQVFDDTACMVGAALAASRFLAAESCGQCPPCKLGSSAITEHLERIESGRGDGSDVDALRVWLAWVTDGNRCYLAVQERLVVGSVLAAFADELAAHLTSRAVRVRGPSSCRASSISPTGSRRTHPRVERINDRRDRPVL